MGLLARPPPPPPRPHPPLESPRWLGSHERWCVSLRPAASWFQFLGVSIYLGIPDTGALKSDRVVMKKRERFQGKIFPTL